MSKNSLADLAIPGTTITVRVTPNARANKVVMDDGVIKIGVTAPPEDGKANAAVTVLLSKALGVPKSKLTLVQGHKSRHKIFRLD
ncbi:MAG: DUF167 domain-containing protein [Marivita sp.]|uniref:DUF167 domain-containing protein n=1 Tax=Marivita sp. TaxID=2003365 RepID=UPI001B2F6F3D|nr:DUF167 domain-containing protein [Marivita sp.]MBO6882317.1 DUF167 domain-containing protein [Marivita sp.]